ncbi:MAG: CRISPR system precrRNA processing endoribonuclease RAMP protein Cas6 [Anaerolineales bacterium]|nr:CRISPR system precrRNA processing endoribonuclease RAMP protein Cas6 [Anaerolineales bacterium]
MYYIGIRLKANGTPIDASVVTGRGLHGLLFDLLQRIDQDGATWLHKHPSPKPFSMAPYYVENDGKGELVGLRYAVLEERAARLIYEAWAEAWQRQRLLRLGRYQTFYVADVQWIPGPTFTELANLTPSREMTLEFLSPTAFKQGPGSLPLPLPVNVFRWPERVWHSYAPSVLATAVPRDWLDWCADNVFVIDHHIQTAVTAINQTERFTGFVGHVTFQAYRGAPLYLRAWQALGTLAAFCGVGHKTTMGMGAVTRVDGGHF